MYYFIHTSSTISFICPYAFSDAYHSIIYHSPWAESIENERINKQISEFIFWKIERTQTQTKCIHMHTHLRLKHHHTSTSHLQHINLHFTFIYCAYIVCACLFCGLYVYIALKFSSAYRVEMMQLWCVFGRRKLPNINVYYLFSQ